MVKKSRGGFTLIELALSMIFIAILSVTVVLLIQNVSVSYRRGMILNQFNTVGMDLIDDFRISVQNATSDPVTRLCEYYYRENQSNFNACIKDNATSFTLVKPKLATVRIQDKDEPEKKYDDMPVYGAFCTGAYTYVWNSGYFEDPDPEYSKRTVMSGANDINPVSIITKENSTSGAETKYDNFRLLKIYDAGRSICVNEMQAQNNDTDVYAAYYPYDKYTDSRVSTELVIDVEPDYIDAIELLNKDDTGDLVLYDLYVARPAFSATRKNLFYAASFILGTKRGGAAVKEAGNSCKPPSDAYSELEYCAINKFNFAVMAGGQ